MDSLQTEISSQTELEQDKDSLNEMVEQKRIDAGIDIAAKPKPDVFQRVAANIRSMPTATADQLEARRAALDAEAKQRRATEAMYALGYAAGERYRGCRLDNFEVKTTYQQRVIDTIREYGKGLAERLENREGLVLFGPVGTGKDHLAYALALHVASSGHSVKWMNGQSWFGRVRDAMDTHETERSIIYEVEACDVAVISDPLPPVGDLTQHQATMLYRAIEARYATGKITITTINVADDKEADRRMGAATWDRLCHGAWKIHCNWASHRKPSRIIKS